MGTWNNIRNAVSQSDDVTVTSGPDRETESSSTSMQNISSMINYLRTKAENMKKSFISPTDFIKNVSGKVANETVLNLDNYDTETDMAISLYNGSEAVRNEWSDDYPPMSDMEGLLRFAETCDNPMAVADKHHLILRTQSDRDQYATLLGDSSANWILDSFHKCDMTKLKNVMTDLDGGNNYEEYTNFMNFMNEYESISHIGSASAQGKAEDALKKEIAKYCTETIKGEMPSMDNSLDRAATVDADLGIEDNSSFTNEHSASSDVEFSDD